MPPYFFLSYARRDANPAESFLDEFVRNLEAEVSSLTGEHHVGLGFRDRTQIDLGERWPDTLTEALRTSRVFLALYSPAFFKSLNCGKEWTAFHDRCRWHSEATGAPCPPPLILPVLWAPVQPSDYSLPPQVQHVQYERLDLGEEYLAVGLRTLMKNHRDLYNRFVTRFARLLVEAVKKHPLPSAPQPADYTRLTSAFEPQGPAETVPVPPARVGPGHVAFIILAARAGELGRIRTRLDAYGHHGPAWRPYRPASEKEIGPWVQGLAGEAGFTSAILELGPKLIEQLNKAREDKTILVVLVDPWALFLPSYKEYAATYDQRDFWNGTVLIPWNDQDEETRDGASELRELIDRTFENKATATSMALGRTWAFRGAVSSPRQLARELMTVVRRIREVIIKGAEQPRRAVGPRVIPMPQLTGPGGREP